MNSVSVPSGVRLKPVSGRTKPRAALAARRRCRVLILLPVLMLSEAVAAGTAFAWVTEDGVLFLSDEAPPAEVVDFKSIELQELPPRRSDPSSDYYSIINQLSRMEAHRRAAERERWERRREQTAQDEYRPEVVESYADPVGGYSAFSYGRYPSRYRPLKYGRSHHYHRDQRVKPKARFRHDHWGTGYFADRYRSYARNKAREGVPIKAPRRSTGRSR